MARGRMINKKICNSRVVDELPESAQLLYTWLIPHLDCNGCFYGSAQMIKSLVFPRKNYSKTKIENWLKLMENSRGTENSPLIVRYFVNGEQYLFMPGFKGEQIGLRYDKETPDFPTFDGKNTETIRQKGGVSRREVEVETKVEVEDKETPLPPVSLSLDQVIEAYEKNICLPGTIIDEETENQLKVAVQQFSVPWVIDAIREACLQNNRTLRYIHGILKTWQREGKSL